MHNITTLCSIPSDLQNISTAIMMQQKRMLQEYRTLKTFCDALDQCLIVLNAIEVGGLTDALRTLVGCETLSALNITSTESAKDTLKKVADLLNGVMEKLFGTIVGHVKYDNFLHSRLEDAMKAHRDLDKTLTGDYTTTGIVGLSQRDNGKALDVFAKLFKAMEDFKSTPMTEEDNRIVFDKVKSVVQSLQHVAVHYSGQDVLSYADTVFNGEEYKPAELGAQNPYKYCKAVISDAEIVHKLWAPCYDYMQKYQAFVKKHKNDLTHEQAKYIGKALRCLASYLVLMALYKGSRYKTGFRVLNAAKKFE